VTLKLSAASSSSIASFLQDLPFGIGSSSSGGSITTEIELITSKSNLENVIRNLSLLDIIIPPEKRKPEDTEKELLSRAVNSLAKAVSVNPVKNTNIVEIKAEFPNAEVAARIANELAKVYSERLIDVSKSEARMKLEFISQQLPQSKEQMDKSILRVREYKEAKNIFLISEEAKVLLEIVAEFDKQLNAKKMDLQTTQTAIATIREKLSSTNEKLISSETISLNPLVSELRSKLTNLNIELASLEKLYPGTDPQVLQKRKNIEETQKELSKQVVNIVTAQQKTDNPIYSTLMGELVTQEINYQLFSATIGAIDTNRKEYDKKIAELPAIEQELTELLRDQKINEEIYIALYKSYIDAQVSEASIADRTYIVDSAAPPLYPTKPQKKLIVAIGGVLGIFLGILFVFVLEYLEKRVIDTDELVKLSGYRVPILGFVPKAEKESAALNPNQSNPVFAEAFETIYTRICMEETDPVRKIFVVTSPEPEAGSSTLSYHLAKTMSQSNEHVLLIDSAIRYPNLTKKLGIPEQKPGFAQTISPDFKDATTVIALNPNLDFLPAGKSETHPLALFRGKRFEEWLKGVREEYDRIIIDTPSVARGADTAMISARAEGIFFIVEIGKTRKEAITKALMEFERIDTPVLGIFVNKSLSKKTRFLSESRTRKVLKA
jgi:capsular exopolysaccharide synthesis family protein